MKHLGLAPYVRAVYSSANLGVEKPNPEIYRRVLADLKLSVNGGHGDARGGVRASDWDLGGQVWMIGDNPVADILGAEAVGIRGILVRGDGPRAKRRVADLTEVPRLLGVLEEHIRRPGRGA